MLSLDPNTGTDLSLPLVPNGANPSCYWAEAPHQEVIRVGDFVGSVAEGGTVNYTRLSLTPHGNGTHTECLGHITANPHHTLDRCLNRFWFSAYLISVQPEIQGEDQVLKLEPFLPLLAGAEALVIRTLPNEADKALRDWSGSNPPYLRGGDALRLASMGIEHILVDLPSVDKEIDGGALAFHRNFWRTETAQPRLSATITELIFVPDTLADGPYDLNLMVPHWRTDAAPSRPVLFRKG